jgi:hypothetical protein
MQALRTAAGIALGLALMMAVLNGLGPGPAVAAETLAATAVRALDRPDHHALVAVDFDSKGRPAAHALRRSSGSAETDAAAVEAALEVASLRPRSEVAGRTLLFKTWIDGAPQLD